jgi:hypothetical protein
MVLGSHPIRAISHETKRGVGGWKSITVAHLGCRAHRGRGCGVIGEVTVKSAEDSADRPPPPAGESP